MSILEFSEMEIAGLRRMGAVSPDLAVCAVTARAKQLLSRGMSESHIRQGVELLRLALTRRMGEEPLTINPVASNVAGAKRAYDWLKANAAAHNIPADVVEAALKSMAAYAETVLTNDPPQL
jgi:hypothetical protein